MEAIKDKKFHNLKLGRQHPIKDYIVDFYCHELSLVLEVDGGIHSLPENTQYDED